MAERIQHLQEACLRIAHPLDGVVVAMTDLKPDLLEFALHLPDCGSVLAWVLLRGRFVDVAHVV